MCIRDSAYGVGTNLVTSAEQPALGGVYKLVQLNGIPRMKISQQTEKLIIPSAKKVYRLLGKDGMMLLDLLTTEGETPRPDEDLLALHPSDPFKRAIVKPAVVRPLLAPLFSAGEWQDHASLQDKRSDSLASMATLRGDISRLHNPTPYKVSVTPKLKGVMDELYQKEAPPSRLE